MNCSPRFLYGVSGMGCLGWVARNYISVLRFAWTLAGVLRAHFSMV